MKTVTFDKVKLGGFWKKRFEINRDKTIPVIRDRFTETGRFEAFKCEWKEGMPNEPHIFWDSDIAKWIEAVAYTIAVCPDKELEKEVDEVVDLIEKNQGEDGYFNIFYTVCEPDNRFQNRLCHELYCAGHLTEAAVSYYYATGKDKMMRLMCKYMDYIEKVFIKEDSAEFCTPGHEEIELALVKLYDATHEERYLEMSKHFVETRGRSQKDADNLHYCDLKYDQSDAPVREQLDAHGHSVRATYLYCAMADLALKYKDESLFEACDRLFDSMTNKRMYVTGGIGSTQHGERFTEDYDLPNAVAYSETCASIGLALFARRMSLLKPDSKYADAAETAIYNCALAGVSLNGGAFFYVNPLEINLEARRKGMEFYEQKNWGFSLTERAEVFSCSCCPPNIARMIASIGDFIYTYDENTVYIHHYIDSESEFEGIKLSQKTEYPMNGDVVVKAEGLCGRRLAVRVPAWCEKFEVNGEKFSGETVNGYAFIDAAEGEEIRLSFNMECRLVMANALVENVAGKVALCRGPIVYCAERVDNDAPLHNLTLNEKLNASLEYDPDMLAYTITVDGWQDKTSDSLYRTYSSELDERKIKLIPYFAFANRGASDMLVWLRVR